MASYSLDSKAPSSKVIHINSRDGETYFQTGVTSYFRIFFNEIIKTFENQRLLVSLHSAVVPYSFYNIRTDINDTLSYTIDGSPTTNNIVIPKGNYTTSSLKNKLKEDLDLILTGGVTISYDRITQKFTYSCITPTDAARQLTFNFNLTNTPINIELGFKATDTLTLTNTPQESTNVVDVNGSIHSLFIRTNLSSSGSLDSESKGLNTILGRIPITTNFGSILFLNPNDSTHKILIHDKHLNKFVIKLTDDRNRVVDLNGLHFTIGIQVDFIDYKPYIHPKLNPRYSNYIEDSPQVQKNSNKKNKKKSNKKKKPKSKN